MQGEGERVVVRETGVGGVEGGQPGGWARGKSTSAGRFMDSSLTLSTVSSGTRKYLMQFPRTKHSFSCSRKGMGG